MHQDVLFYAAGLGHVRNPGLWPTNFTYQRTGGMRRSRGACMLLLHALLKVLHTSLRKHNPIPTMLQ